MTWFGELNAFLNIGCYCHKFASESSFSLIPSCYYTIFKAYTDNLYLIGLEMNFVIQTRRTAERLNSLIKELTYFYPYYDVISKATHVEGEMGVVTNVKCTATPMPPTGTS